MIFTGYWKGLVLNFLLMGNTVFFWVKKLMERWYLLVTEKFLFWTFRYGKYGLFSAKKLMERWYLRGLFELSMIFQDLGNMVFRAMCFYLRSSVNISFFMRIFLSERISSYCENLLEFLSFVSIYVLMKISERINSII